MPKVKDFHLEIEREIPVVFVEMDTPLKGNYSVSSRPNVIPFVATCDPQTYYGKDYLRWQLPLIAATAVTSHKSQGTTAYYGLVYEPGTTQGHARSMAYVALSRAPEIEKVTLLGPLLAKQFTSYENERNQIRLEYIRLNQKFVKTVATTDDDTAEILALTTALAQAAVAKAQALKLAIKQKKAKADAIKLAEAKAKADEKNSSLCTYIDEGQYFQLEYAIADLENYSRNRILRSGRRRNIEINHTDCTTEGNRCFFIHLCKTSNILLNVTKYII